MSFLSEYTFPKSGIFAFIWVRYKTVSMKIYNRNNCLPRKIIHEGLVRVFISWIELYYTLLFVKVHLTHYGVSIRRARCILKNFFVGVLLKPGTSEWCHQLKFTWVRETAPRGCRHGGDTLETPIFANEKRAYSTKLDSFHHSRSNKSTRVIVQ